MKNLGRYGFAALLASSALHCSTDRSRAEGDASASGSDAATISEYAADCEDVCEGLMACDPNEQPLALQQPGDCPDDCEEEAELVVAAGCGDLYDALHACMSGFDLCDPSLVETRCFAAVEELQDCIAVFCEWCPAGGCTREDYADVPGECD